MEGEGAIEKEVQILRQSIVHANERLRDKLRALAKEREKRMRTVALEEAYPSRLKEKVRR